MAKLGRTCTQCQGEGTKPSSDNDPTPTDCVTCGGTGYERIGEVDNSDIVAKLDAIIVEQAAQRVDLTAALSQIWNKVKDL